jgi:hypothetical protein
MQLQCEVLNKIDYSKSFLKNPRKEAGLSVSRLPLC